METRTKLTASDELAAWREGDVLVVRRGGPLPPLCVLSGEPATRTVPCLFHWQERPLAGGGPGGLAVHYARNVWKFPLHVPLADHLLWRRRIGWALFALTALFAAGTIGAIVAAQVYLAQLPRGPERNWWRDLGVPLIAAGGFVPTALAMLGSYYLMPMPTVRLKPVRANETHLWLRGAAVEYLAQLPDRARD